MAAAPPELAPGTPERRRPSLPNAVLGMVLFVGVEAMLFSGFISAFIVVKANYPPGMWPPPDQPRLPVEATAFTTLMLLASGALLAAAGRRFNQGREGVFAPMAAAVALGSAFIALQGMEWARLLAEGLTLVSSPYGAFFYVIVGAHALHAVPAIVALMVMLARHRRGELTAEAFTAARIFWYFVVAVWPVLYWKVYL